MKFISLINFNSNFHRLFLSFSAFSNEIPRGYSIDGEFLRQFFRVELRFCLRCSSASGDSHFMAENEQIYAERLSGKHASNFVSR